jgi:hypothetical protein
MDVPGHARLYQLRSKITISPAAELADDHAAYFSLSATGPVWSSSEPSAFLFSIGIDVGLDTGLPVSNCISQPQKRP